jgi:hypothetical protein
MGQDVEHPQDGLCLIELEPAYSATGDAAGDEVGESRVG